jgi:hypothetical protein
VFRRKTSLSYRGLQLRDDGIYADVLIEPPCEGRLRIIGPDAKVEHDVGKSNTLFRIFDLHKTPLGGPYAFMLDCKHVSCEQRVDFRGSALELTGAALIKNSYSKGDISYEVIAGVRLRIVNRGDLPVFLDRCEAELDSRVLDAEFQQLMLMPKEEKETLVTFGGRQGKRIRVSFLNERGNEVLEFTELIRSA